MKTDKETVERVCLNFGKHELISEFYKWNALKIQALKNSFEPLKSRSVPRTSTLKMVAITEEGLQLYRPRTNDWIHLNISPMTGTPYFKSCSFGDQILVFINNDKVRCCLFTQYPENHI